MLEQIGPYTIESEIGRGGMGVVYLATDPRLGRRVAIKALPEELAADASRLERFEREARTLAQLNAPNIAGIHGVEEQDGRRYLVLEFVEGETLADRLDRGPIEPDEAIELATQIARGIAAAHDAGVIHRDLKPANIKITPEGEAKVLDFGLARADDGQSTSGISDAATLTSPVQHSPTTPGVILGTAAYMSPEQARGRRVDKRTDIWSFGVVLYEMLTGASPFVGETATDSIGAILHKDTDFGRLPPDVPVSARRVLARCLQRDRNERYHDINDARLELLAPEESDAVPGAPADSATGRPALIAALVVFVAAIGVAGTRLIEGPAPETTNAPPLRVTLPAPAGTSLIYAEISPDGTMVAAKFELEDANVDGWYLRRLDEADWRKIPMSDDAHSVEFSPGSRYLAFSAPIEPGSSSVRLLRLEIGSDFPPVEVAPLPLSFAPNYDFGWFEPDRMVLVAPRTGDLQFIDANSGAFGRRVDGKRNSSGGLVEVTGALSPTRFLVNETGYTERGYQVDVYLFDIEAETYAPLIENANNAAVAPDGAILFARNDRLFRVAYDPATGELGDPAQLATGFRAEDPWEAAEFSISDSGSICTLPGGIQADARNIAFLDTEGGITTWQAEPRPYANSIAVSPDESRLVATVGSLATGLYEIWGSAIDRPRLRRLRAEPFTDFSTPVFFPDNRRFVCTAQTEQGSWLEIVDFNGSVPPERLTYDEPDVAFREPQAIHPDGDRILVVEFATSGLRLAEIDLRAGEPKRRVLLEGPAMYSRADYSPDGATLAYVSDETGRNEAYVRTINDDGSLGPAEPVTLNGGSSVAWIPPRDPETQVFTVGAATPRGIVFYPVTPGRRPVVGEPTLTNFAEIGIRSRGTVLRGGRYATIMEGEDEKPPVYIDLLLNWYDRAVANLADR